MFALLRADLKVHCCCSLGQYGERFVVEVSSLLGVCLVEGEEVNLPLLAMHPRSLILPQLHASIGTLHIRQSLRPLQGHQICQLLSCTSIFWLSQLILGHLQFREVALTFPQEIRSGWNKRARYSQRYSPGFLRLG